MAGIKSLENLEPVYYGSGREILNDFLLPVLSEAKCYDRVTGYFTLDALLATSQGLDLLYQRKGRMRLAIGIHNFPKDLAEAVSRREVLRQRIQAIRNDLVPDIMDLSSSLEKDRLATVALMIEDGFLEVKAVDTSAESSGIFHSKLLILRDEYEDAVAAMGSLNETASGLGDNFENLMVLRSWTDASGVAKQQRIFDDTWEGKYPQLIVQDLTKELAEDIVNGLGEEYIRRVRLRLKLRAPLADAVKMPSYFFVSGAIPALYPHQERAVIDALSRWPVRVLFSDEVGLGKTFEVAATISYLIRFGGARRVVILTPKSVLKQWQDELHDHFGIEAWLFDSSAKTYLSYSGKARSIKRDCPLSADAPSVVLISAQYARGSNGQPDIFSRPGAILPDVLALDEAHAARVSLDIGKKKQSTRLFRVLSDVAQKIPHLLLATATPMQKDAIEYQSMLGLIGLPEHWQRDKAYRLSLSLTASPEVPSLSDASAASELLLETVAVMKPSTRSLESQEEALLEELKKADSLSSRGMLAIANWRVFYSLFVKYHPARLLTVRNTRRSLEEIGYSFPTRNLRAVSLDGHGDVEEFYDEIDEYISGTYLGVEKVIYPDRAFSDGFVKSSYQQRMASSLYSCGKSLERRRCRLESIRRLVERGGGVIWQASLEIDEEDEDDAFLSDKDVADLGAAISDADPAQVMRAAGLELADVSMLISQLEEIREKDGDPKIDAAIDQVCHGIAVGDKALVFSRYTDTVDALLERWKLAAGEPVNYGVFTGSVATVTQDGSTRSTTKEEIKSLLSTGDIEVMFCSDAASEGLNLQAARVLINVDVPWTPARLEQRIGRVARLGQKAESVEIVNIWYPDSVEQRMYSRISQRLRDYNVAVGEFPEVVADSIRDSILGDVPDNSVQILQEIRNSLQTRALGILWNRNGESATSSQNFRRELIRAVMFSRHCESGINGQVKVCLDDGSEECVTDEEGSDETISLSSRCVRETFPSVHGYTVAKDINGLECAYTNGETILNPERLADLLCGTTDLSGTKLTGRPKWLPDFGALSMGFSAGNVPAIPVQWPPITGDES